MRADIRPLAALLIGMLAAAAAAQAASGLAVRGVDASSYPEVRVTVLAGERPALRENGRPVTALRAENLGAAKSIVLAIDRSRSMAGPALADAGAAARAFAAAKRPADRIAVVGFGRKAAQLTPFSTATADADAALRALAVDARQGTALYDAVRLSAEALAAEAYPGRVVVVLTDGRDVSSEDSLAGAVEAARTAGVSVYAVGIESRDFSPAPLRALAAATGGSYRGVRETGALGAIYAAIGRELSRTWRLSYLTAARPGERVRLDVAAGSARETLQLAVPGPPPTPSAKPALPSFLFDYGLGGLLAAAVGGAAAFVAGRLLLAAPAGTALRRRLEPHVSAHRKREKAAPRERFAGVSPLLAATEKAFGHLSAWHRLHRLLERADVPLRTVEFVYIAAGAGLAAGLVLAAAGSSSVAILLGMAGGGGAPLGWVAWKARRRMAAFENQLPDLLIGVAASLKAGHSFRQGIQAVVDEGQPPASDEFKRVLTETRLGRPMDDALAEMADRVGSKNLRFVITAVTIQRQVGGSLAGIFDMVADAVRQRQQFARKIKGLTAMGRMSAYVLLGMPFFLAGAITLLNFDYIEPLFSTSAGHKLIAVGLVMMAFGSVLLRRIVSFKG